MNREKNSKTFRLFDSIKVVGGPVMSLVMDLAREEFYRVDNDVANKILQLEGNVLEVNSDKYFFEDQDVTDIVELMISMELGFLDKMTRCDLFFSSSRFRSD